MQSNPLPEPTFPLTALGLVPTARSIDDTNGECLHVKLRTDGDNPIHDLLALEMGIPLVRLYDAPLNLAPDAVLAAQPPASAVG